MLDLPDKGDAVVALRALLQLVEISSIAANDQPRIVHSVQTAEGIDQSVEPFGIVKATIAANHQRRAGMENRVRDLRQCGVAVIGKNHPDFGRGSV